MSADTDLPLLEQHPVVRSAWQAFERGDMRTARRHLADLRAAETTAADADALSRMQRGLGFDWAPWVVALMCLSGWAVLFLRAA